MNIYLLTQDRIRGYNTYDSCIVAAQDADSARLIRPDREIWDAKYPSNCWVRYPEDITVTLIGRAAAKLYKNPQVILASFNAGQLQLAKDGVILLAL